MVHTPSQIFEDLEWCDIGSHVSHDFDGAVRRQRPLPYGRASKPREKFEVVGIYDSVTAAKAGRDAFDGFVHTYGSRYKLRPLPGDMNFARGVSFFCRSHVACTHVLKLVPSRVRPGKVELWRGGKHGEDLVNKKRHGIAPAIKPEIDSLMHAGLGAGKARTLLLFKYVHDFLMLALMPTTTQIANRKSRLKKKYIGGWEMKTFASIMAWAAARMCQSPDVFHDVDQSSFARMNALLVLDCFQHEYVDAETGTKQKSLGLVFTSRNCFNNLRDAVACQGDRLVLSTDGTYRIHFGGWTLVDIGTVCVVLNEKNEYVHRFVPIACMFVRTECAYAYEMLFRAIIKYARSFFDISVDMAVGSIDHSEPIAVALRKVWPEATVITCWPHLVRNARAQRGRLTNASFYEATVLPDIRLLHGARSHKQFLALAEVILESWRSSGESNYADWFDVTYLSPRWNRWHVNAVDYGVLPSQQPIESHHATIKAIASDNLRAPTAVVLNDVLAKVLLYDGTNRRVEEPDHFCEGPVSADIIAKACTMLLRTDNHLPLYEKTSARGRAGANMEQKLVGVVFNSRHAAVQDGMLVGAPVTAQRAGLFLRSLEGVLPATGEANDVRRDYLSLHVVKIDRVALVDLAPIELRPVWSREQILQVRSVFSCTCKGFHRSGWICSHVAATLHLLGRMDLDLANQHVPFRRMRGRPSKNVGALHREEDVDPDDPAVLAESFKALPGRPMHWPVMIKISVAEDGKDFTEYFGGQISSCGFDEEASKLFWSVKFVDGDVHRYFLDEIVEGVIRARLWGATAQRARRVIAAALRYEDREERGVARVPVNENYLYSDVLATAVIGGVVHNLLDWDPSWVSEQDMFAFIRTPSNAPAQ